MPYEIEFSPNAMHHMRIIEARDRAVIWAAIREQLQREPMTETQHRKRMRPNRFFPWQLSVQNFRVFYDAAADPPLVIVLAIGIKEHEKVRIGGEVMAL